MKSRYQRSTLRNRAVISTVLLAMLLLSGCAATTTAISKRNLDVQTRMSETVFLDPVAPAQQTVYVQVRNTSDKELALNESIQGAIESRGYRVVRDPKQAHYMLQASVLQVGKMDPSAASRALAAGYGGAIDGAAIGVLAAASSHNTSAQGVGGFGLLGGVVGTVANAAVKDVTYSVITDLQISERAGKGVMVQQQTDTNMSQGSSTRISQQSNSVSEWKRYRTRIVSSANKVNLDFDEAKGELEKGLVRSISGIF